MVDLPCSLLDTFSTSLSLLLLPHSPCSAVISACSPAVPPRVPSHRQSGHLLRCAVTDRARAGWFPSALEAGFPLTLKFPYRLSSALVG